MRLAATFAVQGKDFRLLHGPEVPLPEQVRLLKAQIIRPTITADRIEIWSNGAKVKTAKLPPLLPITDDLLPAHSSPSTTKKK